MPLVVIGGVEYGAGSSRDWAAKGTALLGVKAVIAESFERIHRSNLVGMGVIPFEFTDGDNRKTLGLKGDEVISISGLAGDLKPLAMVPCTILYADGRRADDRAQVPDRYRDRDRVRRARRRAALRAAQPRAGGLRPAPARARARDVGGALEGLTGQRPRPAARHGAGPSPKARMRLLPFRSSPPPPPLVPLGAAAQDDPGGARALHQPGLLVLPAGGRAPDRARRPRRGDRAGAARRLLGLSRLEGRLRPAAATPPASAPTPRRRAAGRSSPRRWSCRATSG